jgi:hypothetical protein
LTGAVGLSAGTNITITTSGNTFTISSTAGGGGISGPYVISINGISGSIGITNGSGIGINVSGQTLTFLNTGVLSFNGLTGAVTGVTTGVANTFGPVQTFNGGIVASGATLTGNVYITGLNNPSIDSQAANKAYVDSVASVGIHYHTGVTLASTDSETFNTGVTYDNGASGVGATLRKTASFARINIDSTDGSTGDRILIRSAATQQWNGVYSVTNQGSGSTGWILTRTTDADNYHPYENDGLGGNDYFFVTGGSSLKNNAYICSNAGGITFGTTAITFAIFSTPPVYTAGTGLAINSLQFSNTGVLSFNGSTGSITGVSSIRGLTGVVGITNGSGIGLSVSGQTLTFSNTGVLSIDGGTGAITNVARTNVANVFTESQTIGVTSSGLALILRDTGNNNELYFIPGTKRIIAYDDLSGNQQTLQFDTTANNTVTLPSINTTLAGLASVQTFTDTNTFNVETRFPGGISAAGATFSSLVRFNAGISSAGGTFSSLVRFNAGISAAGGTFSGTQTFINGATFTGNISAPNIVNSVRGLTGAVGITNGSGIGLSVSGQTMTFSNTGVLSIDGGTGAITNVARTNVDNIFSASQSIVTSPAIFTVNDNGSLKEFILDPDNNVLAFGDFGNYLNLYFPSLLSSSETITFPNFTTTLAGLSGTQTFTGIKTFNALTNFPGGISAAGATFSSLARFNAGISSAGGTFSSQARFLSGITVAGGATFATDISVNGMGVGLGAGNQAYNVALGTNALQFNTTGNFNLAIGAGSLQSNLDGTDNIALGYASLNINASGLYNVGVGSSTLVNNTSGSRNTAIGVNSVSSIDTGNDNVGIGYYSLGAIGSGRSQNTAIGSQAGYYRGSAESLLLGATGGIYIGYQSRASANTQTNEIVIGTQAVGLGSNTAVIGATAQTAATIYGLLNLPGGISAAGGTFSSLTRFTAGLSASNGMTLTGTMSLNGQTFTNVVSSINGLTGNINLAAGSNITITPSGLTLTIASTGGGGGGDVSSVQGLTGDVILSAVTLYMFDLGIV